jgi:solute carrier family 25 carnitine/acylcarnitine transporter 20/29
MASSSSSSFSSSSSSPTGQTPQQPNQQHHRLVGTGHETTEALRGLLCGTVYGLTSPLVGHPLDTIKTKMQAQNTYANTSAMKTLLTVFKNEGMKGLYRGLLPPLVGSSIFRSVQFSAYAWAYSRAGTYTALKKEIPYTGGIEVRVIVAGIFSSTVRASIEAPLEYIKVRKQTNQGWLEAKSYGDALRNPFKEIRSLYRGFSLFWTRTYLVMGTFFILVDSLERHHSDWIALPIIGPFMKGGVCATLAWIVAWPAEVMKNQIQAGTKGAGEGNIFQRAKFLLQHRGGIRGLYRGMGPGIVRSLIANGSSMIAFSFCQQCFREASVQ